MAATVRRFFLRLFAFARSARADRELDRELATHLALLEDEHRRRGLAPDEARLAARRALGGVDRAKEEHRDERSFRWLEDARRDARYALRALARDRGFTCAALLTLTVGIGATTAIFGGVNAVLLRPLPLPAARASGLRLRGQGRTRASISPLRISSTGGASRPSPSTSPPRAPPRDAAGVRRRRTRAGPPRLGRLFPRLGVTPPVGRDFTEADDVFGAPRTVLVSDALWRDRFGADPALVGTTLMLNGETHTVIGVLPPGEGLFERAEQFYVPLAIIPPERASTGSRFLTVIARLAPGVTREQAQTEMAAIAARIATVRPQSNTNVSARRRPASAAGRRFAPAVVLLHGRRRVSAADRLRERRQPAARARDGPAARGGHPLRARRRAGRLVRQFVMESIVLGALGGAAGLVVAASCAGLVPWLIPGTGPLLIGSTFSICACSRACRSSAWPRAPLWPDARVADGAPRSGRALLNEARARAAAATAPAAFSRWCRSPSRCCCSSAPASRFAASFSWTPSIRDSGRRTC